MYYQILYILPNPIYAIYPVDITKPILYIYNPIYTADITKLYINYILAKPILTIYYQTLYMLYITNLFC